jgi:hypothetical protein
MSRGRNLIASARVALCLAAGLVLFPVAVRGQPVSAAVNPVSISILAPSSVPAGGELCFQVICYGGKPSVGCEVNEIQLPPVITPTSDPAVFQVCVKVPGGAGGSGLVITAVSPDGSVATVTVPVH